MSRHFYSMKRSNLSDIADYLNELAKREDRKIIHWQVVPINLDRAFPPEGATYSVMIEYEKVEMVDMHPSS